MRHISPRAWMLAASLVLPCAFQIAMPPTAHAELRDLLPFGRTHRINKLLPAVVSVGIHKTITDTDADTGQPQTRQQEAYGSGFIIDPSGLIATNNHVIDGAADITVTLQDGTALPAKLIGTGIGIDLALLQVEAPKPLPTVKWGDSNHVHIGDQVLIIGDPLGVGETVSSGIVSALNRDIQVGAYDDFIQTDAAINHGNSGGPMFDTNGQVIGINTAFVSSQGGTGSVGLGFAIPSNDAQFVFNQLRKFGRTRPGRIGARLQDMTPDIADALGVSPAYGTIVAEVVKGGPASRAMLQIGDVVLKFGDHTPKDSRALSRMIAQSAGQTVPLVVWRDGLQQTVPITIAEAADPSPPKDGTAAHATQAAAEQPPDLGLHTGPLTDEARAKFDLSMDKSQPGVVVTEIVPRTAAAGHGLSTGDVILRVQQTPVGSPADLQKGLDAARKQNRHFAVLLVDGHDGPRWVALPLR